MISRFESTQVRGGATLSQAIMDAVNRAKAISGASSGAGGS
jgi:hypothetical protein